MAGPGKSLIWGEAVPDPPDPGRLPGTLCSGLIRLLSSFSPNKFQFKTPESSTAGQHPQSAAGRGLGGAVGSSTCPSYGRSEKCQPLCTEQQRSAWARRAAVMGKSGLGEPEGLWGSAGPFCSALGPGGRVQLGLEPTSTCGCECGAGTQRGALPPRPGATGGKGRETPGLRPQLQGDSHPSPAGLNCPAV